MVASSAMLILQMMLIPKYTLKSRATDCNGTISFCVFFSGVDMCMQHVLIAHTTATVINRATY
jgi:hypothetical protein